MLQCDAATREVNPATDLIIVRSGGRIGGYAHVMPSPTRTICGELMAESHPLRISLVAEVERRAKGTAVAFQHTPVTDTPELFRGRGYSPMGTGWYVFMAGSLERKWTSQSAIAEFAVNDPRFLCLAGDRF
jgi:hypothetical protein